MVTKLIRNKKNNYKDIRKEPRHIPIALELIDIKHNKIIINAVVSDKSESGYGVFTASTHTLYTGCHVSINNIKYKVCWLTKISKNIVIFGVCINNNIHTERSGFIQHIKK